MDRTMNHVILPAAQGMGHGNTGTHRQADKEVDNQIGDGSGSTNRSHRNAAAESANHDQVGSIEQQL